MLLSCCKRLSRRKGVYAMQQTIIESITAEPLTIPLLEPFTIATGSVSEARNVLITIVLRDGSTGYGECAPFPPSTGESQETALAAARGCIKLLEGRDPRDTQRDASNQTEK